MHRTSGPLIKLCNCSSWIRRYAKCSGGAMSSIRPSTRSIEFESSKLLSQSCPRLDWPMPNSSAQRHCYRNSSHLRRLKLLTDVKQNPAMNASWDISSMQRGPFRAERSTKRRLQVSWLWTVSRFRRKKTFLSLAANRWLRTDEDLRIPWSSSRISS